MTKDTIQTLESELYFHLRAGNIPEKACEVYMKRLNELKTSYIEALETENTILKTLLFHFHK